MLLLQIYSTKSITKFFILVFSFLGCLFCFSQDKQNELNEYEWFDSFLGEENSGLFNGVLFVEEFNCSDGDHRYYASDEFVLGEIFYNGQIYFNQKLKYDIYADEILVSPKNIFSKLDIQLRKKNVKYFSFKNHFFLNINEPEVGGSNRNLGFCELMIEKEELILMKKRFKKRTKKRIGDNVFDSFEVEEDYYLKYRNSYYPVNSRKDWISIFPEKKKKINSHYKSFKVLLKSDSDTFTKSILEHIN